MTRWFKFFSIAYPIMFISGLITAIALKIPFDNTYGIGYGYVFVVLCGLYLGYDYAIKDDSKLA